MGGRGESAPPEISDREIFADVSGKKRQGKKGKGVKIEKKTRKIVKGKWTIGMEVGKVIQRGEDFFFFFFFFFPFHFWKWRKFVLGVPKGEFSTEKKHFTPGKKSGKLLCPLRKICLLRPWWYIRNDSLPRKVIVWMLVIIRLIIQHYF